VTAIRFEAGRSDESPGRELLCELNELLNAQYPGRVHKPGSVTTPDEMGPPGGVFLVGYAGERAVAVGGVRRLADGVGEIKRMYVVPDARSRGVGRALLVALELACRQLGYERVRLDAGPAQTHSKSLFERTGYVEIGKYNNNHIADYFAEKDLRAGVRSGTPPGPAARPPRAP
jgi:GNAT superfamily N-acetyltransferase